jgi:hypothetical protein
VNIIKSVQSAAAAMAAADKPTTSTASYSTLPAGGE